LREARIECIAGNYEVAIGRGDPDCGCGYRDPRDNGCAQLMYDYTRAHTSSAYAAWMRTLPTRRRERIGGLDVHFVHGSTLQLNDFWWESLTEAEHAERVAASGADVICCTHSGPGGAPRPHTCGFVMCVSASRYRGRAWPTRGRFMSPPGSPCSAGNLQAVHEQHVSS
jgi:hypothetical protein